VFGAVAPALNVGFASALVVVSLTNRTPKTVPVSFAAEPVPPVALPMRVKPPADAGMVAVLYLPARQMTIRSPAWWLGSVTVAEDAAPGAPLVAATRETISPAS
jgi:hypothetical protein